MDIFNADNLPANAIRNTITVCSTAQSFTSNATLANIPGLAAQGTFDPTLHATGLLRAGATYRLRGHLAGTAGASGGIKVAIGGTCTVTSLYVDGLNYNGTTLNAHGSATALATAFGGANAIYTDFYFDGVVVVNAAGTLTVQAAQNTSNGTATTVTTNSYLEIDRIA